MNTGEISLRFKFSTSSQRVTRPGVLLAPVLHSWTAIKHSHLRDDSSSPVIATFPKARRRVEDPCFAPLVNSCTEQVDNYL